MAEVMNRGGRVKVRLVGGPDGGRVIRMLYAQAARLVAVGQAEEVPQSTLTYDEEIAAEDRRRAEERQKARIRRTTQDLRGAPQQQAHVEVPADKTPDRSESGHRGHRGKRR